MSVKNIFIAIVLAYGSTTYSMENNDIIESNTDNIETARNYKMEFLMRYGHMARLDEINSEDPEYKNSVYVQQQQLILAEIFPFFLQTVLQENITITALEEKEKLLKEIITEQKKTKEAQKQLIIKLKEKEAELYKKLIEQEEKRNADLQELQRLSLEISKLEKNNNKPNPNTNKKNNSRKRN